MSSRVASSRCPEPDLSVQRILSRSAQRLLRAFLLPLVMNILSAGIPEMFTWCATLDFGNFFMVPYASPGEPAQRGRQVHISPADNDADPPVLAVHPAVEECRQPEHPRGFDNELKPGPDEPHRSDEIRIADRQHIVYMFADQRECVLSQGRRACPVGNGFRAVHRLKCSGPEGARCVIPCLRLNTDDLAAWGSLTGSDCRTAQESSASARHEQTVKGSGFLEKLKGSRALSGNDGRIIKRRYDHHAASGGHFANDLLTGTLRRVIDQDPCAIGAGRFDLHGGSVCRHHDGGIYAEQAAHQRHCLSMVARGICDHSPRFPCLTQATDRVVGASKLERARALQVLTLEKYAVTAYFVQESRGDDRRPTGHSRDSPGRFLDIFETDHAFSRSILSNPYVPVILLRLGTRKNTDAR